MMDSGTGTTTRRKGHTLKEFDRELKNLSAMVETMGCRVLEQYDHAVKALKQRDPAEVKAAREADDEIDDLQVRIDQAMLRLLALHSPMALDLRAVIAASKIAGDLERIGDHSGSLAKKSLRLEHPALEPYVPLLERMADEARAMLAQVLQAIAGENADLAASVWHRDDILDNLHDELVRQLTANLGVDAGAGMAYSSILYAANSLERIGDHVTNIAEHVHFQAHGENYQGR